MVYIGMIFQYDATSGTGLMMFSDGEQRSFTMGQWADSENQPATGQKVSYENSAHRVQIKVAATDAEIGSAPMEVQAKIQEDNVTAAESFSSVEAYMEHYTSEGFKLVKDTQVEGLRTLSLRKLEMGEPIEIIIKERGPEITVAKMVNGKTVASKE